MSLTLKFLRLGGPLSAVLLFAGCAQNAQLSDESQGTAPSAATAGKTAASQAASATSGSTSQQPQAEDVVWTAAQASDLRGTWIGSVDCGKGAFELQLQVSPYKGGAQMIGGQATFKPSAGNKFRQGSSGFKGEVTKGDVILQPNGVVQKSVNLPSVSMKLVARKGPDRLVGEFVESGCKSIDLRRPAPIMPVKMSKPKASK